MLKEWGKPQLEALYATKLGVFQPEKLKLQPAVKALKRKAELVHQAINSGQIPDLINIELTIATELARAEEQILRETENISKEKHMLSHHRNAELF